VAIGVEDEGPGVAPAHTAEVLSVATARGTASAWRWRAAWPKPTAATAADRQPPARFSLIVAIPDDADDGSAPWFSSTDVT
jgi:hypothetical protein